MRDTDTLRSRLVRVAVAATLVGGLAVATPSGAVLPRCDAGTPAMHVEPSAPRPAADAALTAMVRCYAQSDRYLAGWYPDPSLGETAGRTWPLTQATAAAIMAAQVDGGTPRSLARVRSLVRVLGRYWDARARPDAFLSQARPPHGGGGDVYYDDNAWAGLDLLAAHRLLGDPGLLHRAEQVFTLSEHGWDRSRRGRDPGGVYWTEAVRIRTRNTVSTAAGAVLGLELYRQTHDRRYLRRARSMVAWVERNMRSPDGLFWDHVGPGGALDRREWSYNQGLMIGANTLLYQATGDRRALAEARRIAAASLRRWGGDLFEGQPRYFNAIFLRELARLDTVAPDPAYRALAERYAAKLRSQVDPRTGLLRSGGELDLLDQAALVQVEAVAASMRPLDGTTHPSVTPQAALSGR